MCHLFYIIDGVCFCKGCILFCLCLVCFCVDFCLVWRFLLTVQLLFFLFWWYDAVSVLFIGIEVLLFEVLFCMFSFFLVLSNLLFIVLCKTYLFIALSVLFRFDSDLFGRFACLVKYILDLCWFLSDLSLFCLLCFVYFYDITCVVKSWSALVSS